MPPVNTFRQGAVGTNDRVADIHPESWNQNVHKSLPYNRFPMMTIMDAMAKGTGTIDSQFHHWWEEAYVSYTGTVLDVYTAPLLTAYVSGGTANMTVYLSMTANEARQITEGCALLLTNATNNTLRTVYVTQVVIGSDTTSYVSGTLAEADTGNVLAQTDLSWALMSDAHAEGSELTTATSHDPAPYQNVCQISMGAVEITGSEEKEKERINGTKWARDKKNAMIRMKMQEEFTNLFGQYKVGTGVNGKRKNRMRGAYYAIKENDPGNIIDWRTASGYSGSWLNSGLNWIKEVANDAAMYSESTTRTVFAGNAAWKAISDAVEDTGYFRLETNQTKHGIKISTLIGLTQDWHIILSPTMTTRGFNNSMFVADMNLIRKKVFRPLKYIPAGKQVDGYTFVDGKKEGWLQETTQEIVNTRSMRWLDGIGFAHA